MFFREIAQPKIEIFNKVKKFNKLAFRLWENHESNNQENAIVPQSTKYGSNKNE